MAHRLPLMLGIGGLYGAIVWCGAIDSQLRALLDVQVTTLYSIHRLWVAARYVHCVRVCTRCPLGREKRSVTFQLARHAALTARDVAEMMLPAYGR
jgi:hypothetical protein